MLNTITVMGRITADPEMRETQSGVKVTSFSVAVERDYTDKKSGEKVTDFMNVTAWRGGAEFVCKYFAKGSPILVSGSLESNKFTDRDGNNRTNWYINADHIYFAGGEKKASAERPTTDEKLDSLQRFDNVKFVETDADDGELPF